AWAAAYGQLADLFISTEKAIYEQHQQTKGSWLGWRNFKIAKKVVESDEITSFYLAPVDGGDLPKYEAGQYISVRVFV
ncbi:nitric oxide dioxygenase, partial [Pseudomonas sp. 5C2]|nr:nitric oxide dioxygenase [Pseudomonas sp. 5C2]